MYSNYKLTKTSLNLQSETFKDSVTESKCEQTSLQLDR